MSQLQSALLDMDKVKVDPAWALRVPASLAVRRMVMPFALVDDQVYVACADASDATALEAVERFLRRSVVPAQAERESLQRALARVYNEAPKSARGSQILSGRIIVDAESDDPTSIVNEILSAAVLREASDIHIEPSRDGVRVRLRVDGVLEEYRRISATLEAGLISRLKVLAGMDIAERRAPQDGAFTHRMGANIDARAVDIRAATLPTKYGEKVTLRLLGLHTEKLTLESLGMSEHDLRAMEQVLDQPHGLVLLTGPTGSGKTTTLYAAIEKMMQSSNLNIITVEDPIEYDIPGVSQVEVDSAEKISFGKALRSLLRHDPDVLMIGEIRDFDTLDVAVKSALTGHLVLSTLHTNSAASAVTRLTDMGLPGYLTAATLRVCVAQRLVRKLCSHCRTPRRLELGEAGTLGIPASAGGTVFDPKGCIYCAGKGFSGRVGLFEAMVMSDAMRELVSTTKSEAAIRAAMQQAGCPTLIEDAAQKVLSGVTTVREVVQAVSVW